MKQKAFFIIFKKLSIVRNCLTSKSGAFQEKRKSNRNIDELYTW